MPGPEDGRRFRRTGLTEPPKRHMARANILGQPQRRTPSPASASNVAREGKADPARGRTEQGHQQPQKIGRLLSYTGQAACVGGVWGNTQGD